jgi:hypothetical protein
LNPRELFFGLIDHHKYSQILCYNCLLLLKKKIAAIFEYLDCNEEHYINSDSLLNLLTKLDISEKDFKMFEKKYELKNSIIEFVNTNSISRAGYLSKSEFINSVLLAFWDNHTSIDRTKSKRNQNIIPKK